jgi:hypothetical protein
MAGGWANPFGVDEEVANGCREWVAGSLTLRSFGRTIVLAAGVSGGVL